VEFFRPTWAEFLPKLRQKFDHYVAEAEAASKKGGGPSMGLTAHVDAARWVGEDVAAWRVALAYFEEQATLADRSPEGRLEFLDFALRVYAPLAAADDDGGEKKRKRGAAPLNPAWHPICAVRHLLDQWYGANAMFMGDGYTWSEEKKRGHREWLCGSFENFDLARVSIFPEPEDSTTRAEEQQQQRLLEAENGKKSAVAAL